MKGRGDYICYLNILKNYTTNPKHINVTAFVFSMYFYRGTFLLQTFTG